MAPRLRLLVWLVLSLLVVAWSGTALATEPCNPYELVRRADRVVFARTVVKPAPRIALLWVHKYYKGSGPRLLVVQFDGIWASNSWAHTSSGHDTYFGLRSWLGNRIGMCSRWDGKELLGLDGPGVAPYPGINPITPWALFYEAVIGYLLYRGYRWYRRRRERQVNES